MQIQKNVDNKQPQVKFANVTSVSRYIKHKYINRLGLMAYWYTGSAFFQIPQSYLNYKAIIVQCNYTTTV